MVKVIVLLMFMIVGCTNRYYRASDVRHELRQNSRKLDIMQANIEHDFMEKVAFYEFYTSRPDQNAFFRDDLAFRIRDLEIKKDSLMAKSTYIKDKNDNLLDQLADKGKVKESDEAFDNIESFADTTKKDANGLFLDYAKYINASQDFLRFALITL
ncbi:hypothetical protein ACJVC5_19455 [Peredibacter sp. HCB2-198]|uniref:hypothetical protein n=1 Tax=Peredibacter sp. HCB2-198 TaxID=3383025 RepID=UPI0038B4B823